MFLMMLADRHKRPNRSVRLPEDLEQRVDVAAKERGLSFNAFMVEAARAAVDGHTTKPAREPAVTPQPRKTVGYSKEQQARGRKP